MTTQLSREQILGHAVLVDDDALEPEPGASQSALRSVSPWLVACGALAGAVVALVLWYVLPVEAARAGLWEPGVRSAPASLVAGVTPATPAPVRTPAPTPDTSGTLWVRCDLTWTAYTSHATLHKAVFSLPDWAGRCAVDEGWGTAEQDDWQRRHP